MSQQFFVTLLNESMESACFQKLLIVIILLILGWNSLQFPYYLCSNSQLKRFFYNTGSEPVICLIHVDILVHFFTPSVPVSYNEHWHRPYFRPKPPWLIFGHMYMTYSESQCDINAYTLQSDILILKFPLSYRIHNHFCWLNHPYHQIHNALQQLYSKYCNSQFTNTIIMLTTNSFSNKRPKDAFTQHGLDFCDLISLEDANLPSRPPYE